MNKKHIKRIAEIGAFALILFGIYHFGIRNTSSDKTKDIASVTASVESETKTETAETADVETADVKKTKADFSMTLKNAKGKTVSLADYKGKVIFINFWATWCPPCIAEMPSIEAMYNDIDLDKFEVLMVSFDRNFQKAIDYKERNNFGFDVYELDGPIPAMYNTRSIPTTYIIDAEGNLAFKHTGTADYNRQDFKDFLKTLM